MSGNNSWKSLFRILLLVFILLVLGWLGLQGTIFWTNKSISDKDIILSGQNAQLETYKTSSGFVKLMAVKELEGKYNSDIPWSTHIQKVIAMLGEIKSLDNVGQSGSLILSDFNVTLEKLSVKGRVSNLLLLYYTNVDRGIISLIDRFKQLDFISDMRIKNYTKNKDTGFFGFVLEANVNKDAK